MNSSPSSVSVSVVVVVYDMARELPRTLHTLSKAYQRGGAASGEIDYEVIVVDNGSPVPVDAAVLAGIPQGRLIRIDPAPRSPARACNVGIEAATGAVIGVLIDGARMVSPGLIDSAYTAISAGTRVIATTLAFHLGEEPQMAAAAKGYDQAAEDALLATVDWQRDGDQLFAISTFAGSSARGWYGPMGECNALFMEAELWREIGGFDEVFERPGGGLVNHDLYRRACAAPDTDLVMMLGEGSFHQFHGGAATGGTAKRDELWTEYERLRGEPFEPPRRLARHVGTVPSTADHHHRRSVAWRDRHSE